MRRTLTLLTIVATAVALAAIPAASATEPPLREVKIEFRADGFTGEVRSEVAEEKVVLSLYRRGQVALYETAAEIGEGSLKARFGQLGEIDFDFTPKPGAGCAGDSEGTYHGSFSFTGENEYVHFELDHAHGTLLSGVVKGCKEGKGSAPPEAAIVKRGSGSSPDGSPEAKSTSHPREAFLSAHNRHAPFHSLLVFTQPKKQGYVVYFNAFLEEKAEGMEIARGVQTAGGPGSFSWDFYAGTARIDPPRPLLGSAVLRKPAHGPAVWSGSLRVPVLGGRPIRLAGPGIRANLVAGSILD